MPRETVMGTEGESMVRVGWNHHGGVQLGAGVGREFTFTDGPDRYSDLWVNLNRQGCNELIRHLRRARDAAFGADA